jgi:hypothetical protein
MASSLSGLGRQGRVIGALDLFLQNVNFRDTHAYIYAVRSGDLDIIALSRGGVLDVSTLW